MATAYNRAATLPQVVAAITCEITQDRLGVRLSNLVGFCSGRDILTIKWPGDIPRPFVYQADIVRLCMALEEDGLGAVSERVIKAAVTQLPHTPEHIAAWKREVEQ